MLPSSKTCIAVLAAASSLLLSPRIWAAPIGQLASSLEEAGSHEAGHHEPEHHEEEHHEGGSESGGVTIIINNFGGGSGKLGNAGGSGNSGNSGGSNNPGGSGSSSCDDSSDPSCSSASPDPDNGGESSFFSHLLSQELGSGIVSTQVYKTSVCDPTGNRWVGGTMICKNLPAMNRCACATPQAD